MQTQGAVPEVGLAWTPGNGEEGMVCAGTGSLS